MTKETRTIRVIRPELRFRRLVLRNTIYYMKSNDYKIHFKREKDIDLIN